MNQMPIVTKRHCVTRTNKYSWECPGCDVLFQDIGCEPQSYEDSLCSQCKFDLKRREIEQYLAPLKGGEVARIDVVADPTHTIDVPSMCKISSLRLIDCDGQAWIVLAPGVLYIYKERGEENAQP